MTKLFHRSVGLELAGVKSHRSCVAVFDFYPKTERLVLLDVDPKLTPEDGLESPDEALIKSLKNFRATAKGFTGIGIHGPLSFPPYLKKPSVRGLPLPHRSRDKEVEWMNHVWAKLNPQPRPFLPYLQRPTEIWLRYLTSERFQVTDGFGANGAPLAARLQFLSPHLPKPLFEVFPRATMSRVVSSLHLPKWLARDFSDLEKGLHAREEFLSQFLKKLPQVFIYNRDQETLVLHLACFNAFLAALTQFLIFKDETIKAPRDFPRTAAWIHIPRPNPHWDKIFAV